jgi:hypothetical protein
MDSLWLPNTLVDCGCTLQNLSRGVGNQERSILAGPTQDSDQENSTHFIRLDEEKLGRRKVDAECDWDQKASQQIELEEREIIIVPQD